MKDVKWTFVFVGLIIVIFLIIIPVFTRKVFFADTTDYLGVARYFHGDLNSAIRNTHNWDYGLFLSFFLKMFNSIILLRIINSIWILLTALVLYKLSKNKKVLWLWFLSPIVWYLAPYIHPLPMATFFLTASYYLLKKYETSNNKFDLAISGFFLGIAALFWDGMLILAPFFIISFFFKRKLSEVILFLFLFGISFSIKLFTDWVLFNFPLFSTFRQLGSTMLFVLKKAAFTDTTSASFLVHFIPTNLIFYLFAITPFFFTLYRSFKQYKQEITFIMLIFLFFVFNNQPRYAIIIAPLSLLLISKTINKKELIINSILSVILIIFLIYPAFVDTTDTNIANDLEQIGIDFPNEVFLAGSSTKGQEDDYLVFSTLYYGDKIKEFVSWQDYNLAIKNETIFYQVTFEPDYSKVNEIRNMFITLGMSRVSNRNYSEVKYLISRERAIGLKNFKLVKEYKVLNVFKKEFI